MNRFTASFFLAFIMTVVILIPSAPMLLVGPTWAKVVGWASFFLLFLAVFFSEWMTHVD